MKCLLQRYGKIWKQLMMGHTLTQNKIELKLYFMLPVFHLKVPRYYFGICLPLFNVFISK